MLACQRLCNACGLKYSRGKRRQGGNSGRMKKGSIQQLHEQQHQEVGQHQQPQEQQQQEESHHRSNIYALLN